MHNSPLENQLTIEAALQRAWAHWHAGQAQQAEQLCQRVLQAMPNQPDALQLLAIMANAYGKQTQAITLMRLAASHPQAPALFHSNLAEMCRQQGLLEEAEQAGRRAVLMAPQLMDAWNNLGIILQESGKYAASLACLEKVLQARPDNPQLHNNLANTLRLQGDAVRALHHYRQALALNPGYVEVYSNQAALLCQLGQLDDAAALASQAIAIAPQFASAYQNLADIDIARLRFTEAHRSLDALLAFAPDHQGGLLTRARLLLCEGRAHEALELARRVAEKVPDNASVQQVLDSALQAVAQDQSAAMESVAAHGAEIPDHARLQQDAISLLNAGRYGEMEAMLQPVLASGAGPMPLWHLLARALHGQGKIAEAGKVMELIVSSRPGDMHARFELSGLLLAQGEFTRGWQEYRFRYMMQHTAMFSRHMQQPRWEGQPLSGKTLLIHDEQGFGDTFQFLRLVQRAREQSGARIILEVNKESATLARSCAGWDEIIVRGEIPPAFDYHCELMSLPMALGLQLADLPGATPYLSADAQRIAHWRQRLADVPRPWVGLVWAGRPTHNNDKNRSMTLADLAPLAQPGISFIALQKGPAALQALTPPAGMSLLSLSDEIKSFDDTAAILSLMDVLISVDSSPVHLAGALGRPAWVMLPFVAEWRWMLARSDTPWYPSVTLFRQQQPGQWESVMRDMHAKLTALARSPS